MQLVYKRYRLALLCNLPLRLVGGQIIDEDTAIVTEYITTTSTITRTLGDFCPGISIPFCPYVASSLNASPFPTETILPADAQEFFGIRVQAADPNTQFPPNEFLGIVRDQVFHYNSTFMVGWSIGEVPVWIDDDSFTYVDRALIFDNTGNVLGLTPLDAPPDGSIIKREIDVDDPFNMKIAGRYPFPNPTPARTLSRWGRFTPIMPTATDAVTHIYPVDENNNPVDVYLLGCRGTFSLESVISTPKAASTIYHLNAVYDIGRFYASPVTGAPYPTDCVRIDLIDVDTNSYTHRTATPGTPTQSSTPTPTTSRLSFPIKADIAGLSESTIPHHYLVQNYDRPIVARTDTPPYFIHNESQYLVLEENNGSYLRVTVEIEDDDDTDGTDDEAGNTRRLPALLALFDTIISKSPLSEREIQFLPRFGIEPNGTIIILDLDGKVYDGASFVGCPLANVTSDDEYLLRASFDLQEALAEQPSCRPLNLVAVMNAPRPVPQSSFTALTPIPTPTAVEPEVEVCNALNYASAYTATGVVSELATACYCWSVLASTVQKTKTEPCTVTITDVYTIVTSVLVNSARKRGVEMVIPEDIDISPTPEDLHIPERRQVTQTVTTPGSPTIDVIPTPTDFISAALMDVATSCSSILHENDVGTLTIANVSTLSVTAGTTTITTTEVQTVCYEERYFTALTTSGPVVVICPASVTA